MRTSLTVAVLFALCSVATAQVEMAPEAILADSEWRAEYDSYAPLYGLVAAVGSGIDIDGGISVDVYYAEWCSDSKEEVPRFIKLVEELHHPELEVHYFGDVPHKADGAKYFLTEDKVERVPTFIFKRNGREVGRIVEHPKQDFVDDMLEIVF